MRGREREQKNIQLTWDCVCVRAERGGERVETGLRRAAPQQAVRACTHARSVAIVAQCKVWQVHCTTRTYIHDCVSL